MEKEMATGLLRIKQRTVENNDDVLSCQQQQQQHLRNLGFQNR